MKLLSVKNGRSVMTIFGKDNDGNMTIKKYDFEEYKKLEKSRNNK